jgi:hypothetical protein
MYVTKMLMMVRNPRLATGSAEHKQRGERFDSRPIRI